MKIVHATKKVPVSVTFSLKELVELLKEGKINLAFTNSKFEYEVHIDFGVDAVDIVGNQVWVSPSEEDKDDTFWL